MKILVRRMKTGDLDEVLEIERYSFSYPWSRKDFMGCLRLRTYSCRVAVVDDEVVGYTIWTSHRKYTELVNLAIRWDYRRFGVGSQIIDYIKDRMEKVTVLSFVTSEYNLASQLFLRSNDWSCSKILRNYYDDSDEDAYLMRWDAGDNWSAVNRCTKYFPPV